MTITIDFDAERLLRAMAPHSKRFGGFLSELIRREARERAQRPALLDTLATGAATRATVAQVVDQA